MNLATERGLIIFCWGDDNNCKDTIKHLKSLGIHAIIYDKMDIYSDKAVKVGGVTGGRMRSQTVATALLPQCTIFCSISLLRCWYDHDRSFLSMLLSFIGSS